MKTSYYWVFKSLTLKYTTYMYYNAESCKQTQETFVISLVIQKKKKKTSQKEDKRSWRINWFVVFFWVATEVSLAQSNNLIMCLSKWLDVGGRHPCICPSPSVLVRTDCSRFSAPTSFKLSCAMIKHICVLALSSPLLFLFSSCHFKMSISEKVSYPFYPGERPVAKIKVVWLPGREECPWYWGKASGRHA